MKISILVIAHNEETHIAQCIESLLHQTVRPNEIVLLVHNSTDKTLDIAKRFPVMVVSFNGPTGIVSARLEGLSHVSGDIILCIDGDSYAHRNWVEVMVATLSHDKNVLVGSWVKFKGTIFGTLYTMYSKYACISKHQDVAYRVWGGSYAFWGKDKEFVKEILKKSVVLSHNLKLPRNPDDYWLALSMSIRGNLQRTNKTWITNYTKETSLGTMFCRRVESRKNRRAIRDYFKRIGSVLEH